MYAVLIQEGATYVTILPQMVYLIKYIEQIS